MCGANHLKDDSVMYQLSCFGKRVSNRTLKADYRLLLAIVPNINGLNVVTRTVLIYSGQLIGSKGSVEPGGGIKSGGIIGSGGYFAPR